MHIMHDNTVFNWFQNLIILRISQYKYESKYLHIWLFCALPVAGIIEIEEKHPNKRHLCLDE